MTCVRLVSFSILVNDNPYGHFKAKRGLRQGDPLSPHLFIICAYVLSFLMSKSEQEKLLQNIRISNSGQPVSHLLFADDSLFFTRENQSNSKQLMKIFDDYGALSGQIINIKKSSITFGEKVFKHKQEMIKVILKNPNTGGGSKYLRLPKYFGRKGEKCFNIFARKWRTR